MSKFSILLIAAVAVLSPLAQAQTKPKPAPKPKPVAAMPKTIKCCVMTNQVIDIKEATKHRAYADYKGRRYYFCCESCPGVFKKNPEKYKNNASLPIPAKKK